jgi:hypothetical protein
VAHKAIKGFKLNIQKIKTFENLIKIHSRILSKVVITQFLRSGHHRQIFFRAGLWGQMIAGARWLNPTVPKTVSAFIMPLVVLKKCHVP